MKIAVIAWGSLIWCPGSLQIGSWWHKDGPELPIEFARISDDGRLTLVIYPEYLKEDPKPLLVTTYWAESACNDIGGARENLRQREGCTSIDPIHFVEKNGRHRCDDWIRQIIEDWLNAHASLDAAIWTGLESNWGWRRSAPTSANAVRYLRHLDSLVHEDRLNRAREYIVNAPSQTQTPWRGIIETGMVWAAQNLPGILFV